MKVASLTLHAFIFTSLMCSCGKEIQNSGNGNNFKTSQNHHKAYDPTENLRVAVEKQSRVLVMQALAEKANPNHVTKNGEHILNVAIKVGNIEIVHKLIEAGANINAKNNNNDYALIVAIKNKKKEIAKYLIDCGAKLNYQDQKSPLLYALEAKMQDTALLLVQQNINIEWDEKFGQSAFELAHANNFSNLLSLMQVSFAVKNNQINLDFIKELISNGDIYGLSFIAKFSKDILIKLAISNDLIAHTLDYEEQDLRFEMLKVLLAAGISANGEEGDKTIPLIYATQKGDLEASQLLIISGADINKTNKYGRSALIFATKNLLVDLVDLLLSYGAQKEYTAMVNDKSYFFRICRFVPSKRYFLRRNYQELSPEEIQFRYKTTKELLECK